MKLVHHAVLLVALSLTLTACGRRLPDVEPVAVSNTVAISEPSDAFEEAALAASPVNGSELFNQMTSTGFSCASCHNANNETRLVGPGLLGIPQRGATRVDGQSAAEYIYNSILHPNDYIVEEYPEGVMPATYEEVFSEGEIYDIVAYLLTLEGGADTETAEATDAPETAAEATDAPETAAEATDAPETAAEATDAPETAAESTAEADAAAESTAEPDVAAEVTEEPPAPEVVAVENITVIQDQFSRLSAFGLPHLGEQLYNSSDFACADCHSLETGEPGADGPGLLGIPQVAAYKANSEISPQGYIFNAITNTDVHQYDSNLTDSQAYDLVAFLMQFDAEGDTITIYPESYEGAATDTGGDAADASGGDSALAEAVANADPAAGEALFVSTEIGAPCSSCHLTTSDTLVGPGFAGLAQRAAERGPTAEDYLYTSITQPNAYVVDGYPEMVMPQNYADLMTEEQIYDLIAYLLTFQP